MACEVGSCGGVHKTSKAGAPGASVASSSPSAVASTPPPPPGVFDLASISALTTSPLLADVRKAIVAKDPRVAADALKPAIEKLPAADRDRATFLLGRLLQQAKDEDGADA